MGPRMKKSPTSPTAKQIDAEPHMEAPEGGIRTDSIPAPAPLPSAVLELFAAADVNLTGDAVMRESDRLARDIDARLGSPEDDRARAIVDIAVLHLLADLDAEKVLRLAVNRAFPWPAAAPKAGDRQVDHVFAPPVDRALARLELLIGRLALAKDAANPIPLGPADAEALYTVAFAASEDLCETRTPRTGAEA